MKLIILENYKAVLKEFDSKQLQFLGAFDIGCSFSFLVHSLAFVSIGYVSLIITFSEVDNKRVLVYGLRENC